MKNLSELFDENAVECSSLHIGLGVKALSKHAFIKVVEERIREELIEYEKWCDNNFEKLTFDNETNINQYLKEREEAENE